MGRRFEALLQGLAYIAGTAIFLILLILGIYLLSYILIVVAVIGVIGFCSAQIYRWTRAKRTQNQPGHRVIDVKDIEDR